MLAKYRGYVLFVACFLLLSCAAWAQFVAIEGVVKGPDGQPVKDAQILIEREDMKGTYKGAAGQTLEVGVSVSYENGRTTEDSVTVLAHQPVINGKEVNSYRRYMEMMQQQ